MITAQLPVQGDLVQVDLPEVKSGLYAEAIVSRALAYGRVGKRITSTRAWARSIAASAVRAEAAGGAEAARERESQLEHLSRYRRQTTSCASYAIDRVIDILATGYADGYDFRSVMGQERLAVARRALEAILGHRLVHTRECSLCAAVADKDWETLLFRQDVPETAIRDLYFGLVEARVIPSVALTTPRIYGEDVF